MPTGQAKPERRTAARRGRGPPTVGLPPGSVPSNNSQSVARDVSPLPATLTKNGEATRIADESQRFGRIYPQRLFVDRPHPTTRRRQFHRQPLRFQQRCHELDDAHEIKLVKLLLEISSRESYISPRWKSQSSNRSITTVSFTNYRRPGACVSARSIKFSSVHYL